MDFSAWRCMFFSYLKVSSVISLINNFRPFLQFSFSGMVGLGLLDWPTVYLVRAIHCPQKSNYPFFHGNIAELHFPAFLAVMIVRTYSLRHKKVSKVCFLYAVFSFLPVWTQDRRLTHASGLHEKWLGRDWDPWMLWGAELLHQPPPLNLDMFH